MRGLLYVVPMIRVHNESLTLGGFENLQSPPHPYPLPRGERACSELSRLCAPLVGARLIMRRLPAAASPPPSRGRDRVRGLLRIVPMIGVRNESLMLGGFENLQVAPSPLPSPARGEGVQRVVAAACSNC